MFHRQGNAELARLSYGKLFVHAEALKHVTDLVQVASSHANAENGLAATQVVGTLRFLAETYGSGPVPEDWPKSRW
jgi:hypothetical protein